MKARFPAQNLLQKIAARTCERPEREGAESADLVVSRLLKPEVLRACLPVTLAVQETRSWTADELHLLGLVVLDFVLPEQCTEIVATGKLYSGCMLSDSGKDLEEYEKFMEEVTLFSCVVWRNWAKHFRIAGDFNIELGLLCIDEETDEELVDFYGPLCWQGYGADPCGFRNLMWCSVMREFDRRVTSTWPREAEQRESAFLHQH